jgi:protein-disulfide isomerase
LVSIPARHPTGGEGSSGGDADVLAVVGRSEVTVADVRAARRRDFLEADRQLYELTSQALERAIQIRLVQLEAEARGMVPADLVAAEVDGRLEDPTAEEISRFHEERGLQGSLDQIAAQIRAYLRDQSRNAQYAGFLAELEARYPVEKRLDPLRTEVATEGYPSKGLARAPVTIVEFSDFQCPYCLQILETLDQVQEAFGERVRLVYRHFPLESIHPNARKAAEASMCAHDQGKFWEMHDAMFENPGSLGVSALKQSAQSLGLDVDQFNACLDSDRYADAISDDLEAGREAGVTGTPALFVNGRFLSGTQSFEAVAEIIDDELRRAGR